MMLIARFSVYNRHIMTARYPLIEEVHMAPEAPWCFEALAPKPYSFFLDSGMYPPKLGRYSFMGSDPFLVMRSRGDEIRLVKDGVE
jgi:para-aminobenzoate synthetase component 1